MEFYESQYFIVLIPAVVITVIFLFFWLFMKETSYDEILAKQKRDLKPLPIKAEKKKNEKKKNKKKENQNGNLHESDSENAAREFELTDALALDDEVPVPIPLTTMETSSAIRERKKKEKKQPKLTYEEQLVKDTAVSKPTGKKTEPVPVTKQPTPPSDDARLKKKPGQKKQKNGADEPYAVQDIKTEVIPTSAKKLDPLSHPMEIKQQESGTAKKKGAPKKQKIDTGLVEETLIHPMAYIPLMDDTEPAPIVEKKAVVDQEKSQILDGVHKASSKKLKNETDKENADVRFKDFILMLRNMTFTEEEAVCVTDAMKEKFGVVQDVWQKQSGKGDSVVTLHQLQEKEKLLAMVQEEATIAKEKIKLLNQELMAEKQKSSVMEAKLRERNSTLERDLGAVQNKLQVSYQELQQMQVKFQQVQEQLESQIARLQQENTIFREAMPVSSQKESKQSSEIASLRQECGRLANELSEKNSKLQQEELHKKNAEQTAAQLKVQLQELQNYMRNVKTEQHKAEAGKQELQNKLRNAESEIQNLSSKLADTMVSKEQIEQTMRQLLEERTASEDTLQMQVQASTSSLVEELQKTIADKDKLMKQAEESLTTQHARLIKREEELEEIKNKNTALKVELQQLNAQISEQSHVLLELEQMQRSFHGKDERLKHLEELLQAKHMLVSNQEKELLAVENDNKALQDEVHKLRTQIREQVAKDVVEEMKRSIQEKDTQIKKAEELLQSERAFVTNQEQNLKALQSENMALKEKIQNIEACTADKVGKDVVEEMQKSIQEKDTQIKKVEEHLQSERIYVKNQEESLKALQSENMALREKIQELETSMADKDVENAMGEIQRSIQEKEEKLKTVEELLESGLIELANGQEEIKALKKENAVLKVKVQDLQALNSEQVSTTAFVEDLQKVIHEKDGKIKSVEEMLQTELLQTANKEKIIQALEQENKDLKVEVQNIQVQTAEQASTLLQQLQDLQKLHQEKEKTVEGLQAAAVEREKVIANIANESQNLHKENESLKTEIHVLQQQNIQQVFSTAQNENMQRVLAEKENEITKLHSELDSLRAAVEQQRMKNNELREKNWKAMEALASTEKMLQDKVNKTTKESQQQVEVFERQIREILQRLFPTVPLPSKLNHHEGAQEFERLARQYLNKDSVSEAAMRFEQKLKESEEMRTMIQLECEKYKSVLAETEGILQRLQNSVEEEESKWKVKLEKSQKELRQMHLKADSLEQEVERLRSGIEEAEHLKKEQDHLEMELEKAELERTVYVDEVRELKDLLNELRKKLDDSYSEAVRQNEELSLLKTQLNETLVKLDREQRERQMVAGDLNKAQQFLDFLQSEMVNAAGDSNAIANSDVITTETEEQNRKEKMSASLNQTVTNLQQLLQAVNQQLIKGREHSPMGEVTARSSV